MPPPACTLGSTAAKRAGRAPRGGRTTAAHRVEPSLQGWDIIGRIRCCATHRTGQRLPFLGEWIGLHLLVYGIRYQVDRDREPCWDGSRHGRERGGGAVAGRDGSEARETARTRSARWGGAFTGRLRGEDTAPAARVEPRGGCEARTRRRLRGIDRAGCKADDGASATKTGCEADPRSRSREGTGARSGLQRSGHVAEKK